MGANELKIRKKKKEKILQCESQQKEKRKREKLRQSINDDGTAAAAAVPKGERNNPKITPQFTRIYYHRYHYHHHYRHHNSLSDSVVVAQLKTELSEGSLFQHGMENSVWILSLSKFSSLQTLLEIGQLVEFDTLSRTIAK